MNNTVVLVVVILVLSVSGCKAWLNASQFIYDGFSGADLTTDYEASVGDGLLSLTIGGQRSKGHAFRTYPLNFTDFASWWNLSIGVAPSFSTTFVFSILGQQEQGGLSSDGLAFVLSSTNQIYNDLPSQYLGLVDSWSSIRHGVGNSSSIRLLAIELDTVLNAELGDKDSNHVGIDVDSLVSVASRDAGYYVDDNNGGGEFRRLSLASGEPMQVWVDYDSGSATLNVTMAPCTPTSTKPSRPLLSVTQNLSSVLSSMAVYAGFSSASCELACGHYILGWSFKLNGEAAALNYSALAIQALAQKKMGRQAGNNKTWHKKTLLSVLLPTVTTAIVVSLLVVIKVFRIIRRRSESIKDELDWEKEYGPPSFTYKDLLAATNGFSDELLLGKGGFGSVYKGVLPLSKQAVAVKRVSPDSRQGMREFVAEIVILGHLRHRNLVQLLGYCRHKQNLLLVYDYMPNGSLDCYLHVSDDEGNTNLLCWDSRFRIISGVASGLLYLHEEWEQVVIHRDIKTSNVLLDGDMNARLGDFGLARSHDHGADANTTFMAGTWGYMAPELAVLGKATKATDVYALGVLMMEVACARRPISRDASGEPLTLADWVITAWRRGSIADAVDPRLLMPDEADLRSLIRQEEDAELVLKLGLLCSHPSPNARPSMRLVMQYLQRDAQLPADLQPYSLQLTRDVSTQDQAEVMQEDQHVMSCPSTFITDLSRGR